MSAVAVCPPQPRLHRLGAATIDRHMTSMKVMQDKFRDIGCPLYEDEYGAYWDLAKAHSQLVAAYNLASQWAAAHGLDDDLPVVAVGGVLTDYGRSCQAVAS